MQLEIQVVDLLKTKEDPITLHTLLKELGLPNSDRSFVRSVLRELARRGEVEKHGSKFWVPHGQAQSRQIKRRKHQRVKGRLFVNSKGKAFFAPLDAPSNAPDWIIETSSLGSAKHGDLVLVDWAGHRGRPVGRVVDIVEFGRGQLVGLVETGVEGAIFHPFSLKEQAFPVKGSWLQQIQPDSMVVFQRSEQGEWAFSHLLGSINDPAIDDVRILSEFGITYEFPEQVLSEADRCEQDATDRARTRESFENLNVFTVDGADAKDFDDAIHILKNEFGYELGVHIADVANFVTAGSQLDRHAELLGNSTYLPHRSFPMLPRVLSENLCSLNPDVSRWTLSVILQLDEDAQVRDFRITKGQIKSRTRLTYDLVQKIAVEKDAATRASFSHVCDDLELCLELAGKLEAIRREQGGLALEAEEPRMRINADHEVDEIWLQKGLPSHKMIEMFMCLANETVATFLGSNALALPYRVHEPPDPMKMETLRDALLAGGVRLPQGLKLNQGTSINRLMDEVRARSKPEKWAVWKTLLLRSLKRAIYHPENSGHFGLGLSHYCHFTSPIRRYADLLIHQILTDHLEEKAHRNLEGDELESICIHISGTERASASAENAFFKLKMLRALHSRLGDECAGIIVDVRNAGLMVELNDLFVEGMVPVEDLGDRYRDQFKVNGFSLVGTRTGRCFSIGDAVTVRIERVDIETRRMQLGLVYAKTSLRPESQARSGRSGSRFRGRSGSTRKGPSPAKKSGSRKKKGRRR